MTFLRNLLHFRIFLKLFEDILTFEPGVIITARFLCLDMGIPPVGENALSTNVSLIGY